MGESKIYIPSTIEFEVVPTHFHYDADPLNCSLEQEAERAIIICGNNPNPNINPSIRIDKQGNFYEYKDCGGDSSGWSDEFKEVEIKSMNALDDTLVSYIVK